MLGIKCVASITLRGETQPCLSVFDLEEGNILLENARKVFTTLLLRDGEEYPENEPNQKSCGESILRQKQKFEDQQQEKEKQQRRRWRRTIRKLPPGEKIIVRGLGGSEPDMIIKKQPLAVGTDSEAAQLIKASVYIVNYGNTKCKDGTEHSEITTSGEHENIKYTIENITRSITDEGDGQEWAQGTSTHTANEVPTYCEIRVNGRIPLIEAHRYTSLPPPSEQVFGWHRDDHAAVNFNTYTLIYYLHKSSTFQGGDFKCAFLPSEAEITQDEGTIITHHKIGWREKHFLLENRAKWGRAVQYNVKTKSNRIILLRGDVLHSPGPFFSKDEGCRDTVVIQMARNSVSKPE